MAEERSRGLGSFVDSIKNGAGGAKDTLKGVKDSLKENFAFDVDGIKHAGAECHASARETSEMCATTTSKAGELVAFGSEMKGALDGFNDGVDWQDFVAVGAVLTSDRMQSALTLAGEMDDLAISCARQGVRMIDAIDAGIETLPDILEKNLDKRMENAKLKGGRDGDPEVPSLEEDARALEDAAVAVRGANPANAIDAFQRAFDGISSKGELCKRLFGHMRNFAEDVTGVSEGIRSFRLRKAAGHGRELVRGVWRCLRLSDLIRSFAKAAERIIKLIVRVIEAVREKVRGIGGKGSLAGGVFGKLEGKMESLGIKSDDVRKFGAGLFDALGSKKR